MNFPEWTDIYLQTQVPGAEWPEVFQFKEDRLLDRGKICVPNPLQEKIIYDSQQFLGHVGYQRL